MDIPDGRSKTAERNMHPRSAADVRARWFAPVRGSVSVVPAPTELVQTETPPRQHLPIRVLIADDDEMVRRTLLEAIEQTDGIVVIGTARDAAEAIRIASIRHPDVALLDVRMPGGGGPRAAREIRWRSPDTRIVALSAHRDERSVENMLASGATSYLVKDSDLDDIMRAVTRSVDGDASLSDGVAQHVVSELGSRLAHERGLAEERYEKEKRIRRFIDGRGGLSIAFQPMVELSSGRIVGVEALARFPTEPKRTPDVWFEEATEIGLGMELQVAAVELALLALDMLPVDVFLSVNVDPATAASPELARAIQRWPGERIVIELTEHAPASDYPSLRDALDAFRRSGVRIAVDDAGAGFASPRHILELAPDIIKLDISIVRDIDTEGSQRALASALVGFAHETGTELVAEGVETADEALTLYSLGVPLIQGYFAARPGPIPDRFVIPLPNPFPD
jgi:EAL domain-containing protein (putative c-di-GMP-specific phosphodiesterase class I)/ActR/RegA family two-component response regulator